MYCHIYIKRPPVGTEEPNSDGMVYQTIVGYWLPGADVANLYKLTEDGCFTEVPAWFCVSPDAKCFGAEEDARDEIIRLNGGTPLNDGTFSFLTDLIERFKQ